MSRLTATPAATALIERLRARHGEVFFYLSHGCCDGTTPLCLAPGEMTLSPTDRRWGTVADAAFWLSAGQAEYLASIALTLDAQAGNNGAFSLEDGSGERFVLQQRLMTDEELAAATAPGAPDAGMPAGPASLG
ncbi:DUF779 domain-containing protein [Pseudaquabacterium rugosum]|uniref:DUF779 domain-containing protein n=1 Tax=Pseudaquabacterium rugosum TaxID=2984194 RepID=A0ABU9B970_9BURK